MIEKDKVRLFELYASNEKNNFYLLKQMQFIDNALFFNNIIRKF